MRETDLTGAGPASAADKTGVADGVMGRAKGAGAYEGLVIMQFTGDGIDAGDVQRLAQGEVGQNRGQGAGQQRLARAWRAGQAAVVPAGARDL